MKIFARIQTGLALMMLPVFEVMANDAFNPDRNSEAFSGGNTNLGSTAENLTGQVSNVGVLVLGVAQVVGVVFGVKGIMMMLKGDSHQGGFGKGLGFFLGGVAAYFLPALFGLGGETLFPTFIS